MAPHLSEADRARLNATIHEAQSRLRLADAMDRLEEVTVSRKYGRAFGEVTRMPWFRDCDDIHITGAASPHVLATTICRG